MSTTATEGNEVKLYVVLRSGVRVSESEYYSYDAARLEYEYWSRILKRWPDGTKMDIKEIRYRRNS